MSDVWQNAKVYKFGPYEVAVIKAQKHDPVRYYTEVHYMGVYHSAYRHTVPLRILAVYSALWRAV